MTRTIFFRKNGKIESRQIDGFSGDAAKDLGRYSFAELQSIAGIKSGAVLVRIK